MHDTLSPYYATITTGPGRTADRIITARSHWAAWWLAYQIYTNRLLLIRPAIRTPITQQ